MMKGIYFYQTKYSNHRRKEKKVALKPFLSLNLKKKKEKKREKERIKEFNELKRNKKRKEWDKQ